VVLPLVASAAGFLAGLLYSGYFSDNRWNTGALKTTFRAAKLEGNIGERTPVLLYQLENKTDQDYSIRSRSDIQMFVRDHYALDGFMGSALSMDLPLFVPAKQRVNVTIHLNLSELDQPVGTSQAEVQSYLRDKKRLWNNYDSIVLLDRHHWYEIDFPMIW
jgi:hypothetical protein